MGMTSLKAVTSLTGNTADLMAGTVVPEGYEINFEFENLPGIIRAFRRMVRGLEFDVCEMALTTYLCAREHGVKFIALPIFPVRAFHHGAILHNAQRPVRDPRELEGRRVGVGRGYTVTTGVWARAVLQDEHGVDLSKVTWVLSGDEHVQSYVPPANVVPMAAGETIETQLLAGELIAAVNVAAIDPAIQPLLPEPFESGLAAFQDRGHYPINHCMVVREDVLESRPGLGVALFDAFVESKRRYLERLAEGRIAGFDGSDELYQRIQKLGVDPLPYGIAPNRAVLEQLLSHARTQKIVKRSVEIETLFASETHDLIG
jgi:4,5-dihydroxyphthalate decarboxylase